MFNLTLLQYQFFGRDKESLISVFSDIYLIKFDISFDISFQVEIFDVLLINLKIWMPAKTEGKLMIISVVNFYFLFKASFAKSKCLCKLWNVSIFYFRSHLNTYAIF